MKQKQLTWRLRLAATALLAALLLLATACGGGLGIPQASDASQGAGVESTVTPSPSESPSPTPTSTEPATPEPSPEAEAPEESGEPELLEPDQHPEITMEISNGGIIKLELYPEIAPNTVNNFVSLVQQGFYDGLIFHRVIPDFMIQGGDPEGNGTGGPGYQIPGEFSSNGFNNELRHTRGVISMARSQQPDSAGSQFFIMTEDSPWLDSEYAAFGKVIEGIEVADQIVEQPKGRNDRPIDPLYMVKVTVDTKGLTFDEPIKTE